MARKPRIERASETDVAFGVLVIASFHPNGVASFRRLHQELPIHVRLSDFDTAPSVMNEYEPNWLRTLRNIRKNRHLPGNFVHDGYLIHIPRVGFRITPQGLARRMRGRHDPRPSAGSPVF